MHVGAYYKNGGEPNVSEIKCHEKKGWSKQKKRASCLPYVFKTFHLVGIEVRRYFYEIKIFQTL